MHLIRGPKGTNQPPDTRLHQQRGRTWRPTLTPIPVVLLMTIIGIIFAGFGIALFIAWHDTVSTDSFQYDDICPLTPNKTCIVEFHIKQKMNSPVYLYYDIDHHYHNYRLFVTSRSDWQLMGKTYNVNDLSSCDPHRTSNNQNDQNKVFLPCGQIARNLFSDSYQLFDSKNRSIPLSFHDIVWPEEYDHRFKNPPSNEKGIRVIQNWRDPHFIVWMRATRFWWYIKLYGIINRDLPKGTYYMHINNTWEVHRFGGAKHFYFSTTTWIGGPNIGIAIAFIVVAGVSVVLAFLFLVKHLIAPRPLGDHSLLDWGKNTFMPS